MTRKFTRKLTDDAELKLRLPESLRREIEASAKQQRRSINSEMITLLESALAQPGEFKVTIEASSPRAVANARNAVRPQPTPPKIDRGSGG